MSDVVPHAANDLPADAVEVLRCFAALDIADLTGELAAAAAGLTAAQVERVLDGLAQDGLVASPRPGWFYLASTVPTHPGSDSAPHADDVTRRSRFVEHLITVITGMLEGAEGAATSRAAPQPAPPDPVHWVNQHRVPLLAAVAMGPAGVAADVVMRLAALLWQATADSGLRADSRWRAELSRRGEDAAIDARRPRALAELLQASATAATHEADYQTAEAQWIRAIAIWRELDDPNRLATAIAALGAVYRSWGRWHRALDADFDLVSEYQQRDDTAGAARALHQVGKTMILAGRPDSALEHLGRAERMFADLTSPAPGDHAEVLIDQGRAYWQRGMPGRARRCFSAALALSVDVDDTIAQHARQLLSSPDDQPLPGELGQP